MGGVMTKLIERNTTIPTKKSQIFSTAEDNQHAVTIHVLQGEREIASTNKSLGRFDLSNIPQAPRGQPQIEVTFDIDANGILNVSAKDKATGKDQNIIIKASSGLSENDINKMLQDAKSNEESDKKFNKIVNARNLGDNTLHSARKTIIELKDKISEQDKEQIEKLCNNLENVLKTKNLEEIESQTKKLEQIISQTVQKSYNANANKTKENTKSNEESKKEKNSKEEKDNIVDAEFEEIKENKAKK
jgi:molecular chaperone DnaK